LLHFRNFFAALRRLPVHCATAREKISAEFDKGLCSLQRTARDHFRSILELQRVQLPSNRWHD